MKVAFPHLSKETRMNANCGEPGFVLLFYSDPFPYKVNHDYLALKNGQLVLFLLKDFFSFDLCVGEVGNMCILSAALAESRRGN